MRLLAAVGAMVVACTAAAPALAADPYCAGSYGGAPAQPRALRFGIDPEQAGNTVSLDPAKPDDPARRDAALDALRPSGRELVLRVNRLFWSDGEDGIRRFQQIVSHYTSRGYDVELQVRYHPSSAEEGDIGAWTAYVRHVVDVFGANSRVVAMTITNEDNIEISANTSDGAYRGATDALIQGIIAARDEADRHGWRRLAFGFTYAYRWEPQRDRAFWQAIAAAPPTFRAALGFVGVDDYPGSFYPPVIAPTSSPGTELDKALATVRQCWMAQAALPASVPIWLTENGYPTNQGHTEAQQDAALRDMVAVAHAEAGAYNLTDYRWFNLRDNNSSGSGMFDADGLLRDDYSPKPSFGTFKALIAADGTAATASSSPATRTNRRRRHRARAHRHRRRAHHRHRRPSLTG
jgi:hypothetical protein